MAEGMARRALAGNMAEMTSSSEGVHCDECGSDEVYRTIRKGLFQEKIYPLVGIYPWRCKRCGLRLMLRKRGLGASSITPNESELPETQERKKLRARKSTLAGRSARRRIK